MELLSLTSNNDLVLAKIDDYYFCLAEPSKRKSELNWYNANNYCKSLNKDYSLPNKEELNLIYINKGDLSLVEACLYETNINTLDFISERYNRDHPHYPWAWSSSETSSSTAWIQSFSSGGQLHNGKGSTGSWVVPVRRIYD